MMTANLIRWMLDPCELAFDCGIDTLDPWQADLIRAAQTHSCSVVTSRQAGKSLCSAIIGLHHAIAHEGATILIASASQRQSDLTFGTAIQLYADGPIPNVVDTSIHTQRTITFSNGSRIVSIPSNAQKTRGFTASLVIADEGAFIADDFYKSIRPTLAVSKGRMIILSTPFGKRGFFYKNHIDAHSSFAKFTIPVSMLGDRISPEFLAEEKKYLGSFYAQEYECQFYDTAGISYFDMESVDAAFGHKLPTLADLIDQHRDRNSDGLKVSGSDVMAQLRAETIIERVAHGF